ncbi:hypothetical protein SFRURICE_000244 [Spodoptera frugiperda]|nr:hypothetical protein SFRURICE_000244 [Spodoptera frugiperda]
MYSFDKDLWHVRRPSESQETPNSASTEREQISTAKSWHSADPASLGLRGRDYIAPKPRFFVLQSSTLYWRICDM